MSYSVESVVKRIWLGLMIVLIAACDDDPEESTLPEPEIFPFYYLSVEVRTPTQPKAIGEITFHADDLMSYGYVLWQGGTRRIKCASNTFVDADDELVWQDNNAAAFTTDQDVVFDIVDINGNITRFTPSVTGATTVLIHGSGTLLSQDQLTTYMSDVTREVNKMPNSVYEIN